MSGNFVIYLLGFIVVIAGVIYGMNAAGVAQQWIVTVALVLAGIGIIGALSRSKRGDVADATAEQRRHDF